MHADSICTSSHSLWVLDDALVIVSVVFTVGHTCPEICTQIKIHLFWNWSNSFAKKSTLSLHWAFWIWMSLSKLKILCFNKAKWVITRNSFFCRIPNPFLSNEFMNKIFLGTCHADMKYFNFQKAFFLRLKVDILVLKDIMELLDGRVLPWSDNVLEYTWVCRNTAKR